MSYADTNLYAYKVTLLNLSLTFTKEMDFKYLIWYFYRAELCQWSYSKPSLYLDVIRCIKCEDIFTAQTYHVWFVKRSNGDCNKNNKFLSSGISHSGNNVPVSFLSAKSIALVENDSLQSTLRMMCIVYRFVLLFCNFPVTIHLWCFFFYPVRMLQLPTDSISWEKNIQRSSTVGKNLKIYAY